MQFFSLILVFLLNYQVSATTLIMMPEEQIAEASDVIVEGVVSKIKFGGNSKNGFKTYVKVIVTQGDLPAGTEIVIEELGGRNANGDEGQIVHGVASYHKGESVYLYLNQKADGLFQVNSMALGKYSVEKMANGEEVCTRDANEAEVVSRMDRKQRKAFQKMQRKNCKELRKIAKLRRKLAKKISKDQIAAIPAQAIVSALDNVEFRVKPGKWQTFPVSVFGDTVGDSKVGKDASNKAVANGAQAWTNGGSKLSMKYSGEKNPARHGCDSGIIRVSFNDPGKEITNPNGCGGILAIGGSCYSSGRITGGAVVFNDGWGNCSFWNETNLSEIATHEIGHTIGFSHSWEGSMGRTYDTYLLSATMYWALHGDGRGAALRSYDKDIVNYHYGVGSGGGSGGDSGGGGSGGGTGGSSDGLQGFDIGSSQVGRSITKTVSFVNNSAAFKVKGVDLAGYNPGDFSASINCIDPKSKLKTGETCVAEVTFTPSAKGSRQAILRLLETETFVDYSRVGLMVELRGTGLENNGPSPCVLGNPTLTFAVPKISGSAGQSREFNVTLKNNNSTSCANENPESSKFLLKLDSSSGVLTFAQPESEVNVPPGGSKVIGLNVTSAVGSAAGEYSFTTTALNKVDNRFVGSATGIYSVATESKEARIEFVGAASGVVRVGEQIKITTRSEKGAFVEIIIHKPKGVVKRKIKVGSDGIATTKLRLQRGARGKTVKIDANLLDRKTKSSVLATAESLLITVE